MDATPTNDRINSIIRRFPMSSRHLLIVVCSESHQTTVKQQLNSRYSIKSSDLQFDYVECHEYESMLPYNDTHIRCDYKLALARRLVDLKTFKSLYDARQVVMIIAGSDANIITQVVSALGMFDEVDLIVTLRVEELDNAALVEPLDSLLDKHVRLLSLSLVHTPKEIMEAITKIKQRRLEDRINHQNAFYERLLRKHV